MPQLVWSALLDPHRRRVLELLRQNPMPVGELVTALQLSQPATSKHLRVLREAGLVRVVHSAQRRIYQLEPAPFAELDAWLAPYRMLWNDRLDALGQHLESQHLETQHLETQHLESQARNSRTSRKVET
ncbi:MAG: transcriptional regulator [Frankiales bacterium]|nr:transcriptional regulator [Frankiales bacterium]